MNNIIIYKFKVYVGSNPVTVNYYLLYISTNIFNILKYYNNNLNKLFINFEIVFIN